MTTESAAALLDAAIFTMRRARAELAGAPVAEAAPAPEQSALARFVRRFDALDASDYTSAEQANAYDETAGVLRRRAHRIGATTEALADSESRAKYFEERARHKRAGEPMPYALRTTNERLGYVDAFRLELVDLVDVVQLIATHEIVEFVDALDRGDGIEAPSLNNVAAAFNRFVADVGELLGMLGVYRDGQGIQLARYRKAPPGPPAPPMDPSPNEIFANALPLDPNVPVGPSGDFALTGAPPRPTNGAA